MAQTTPALTSQWLSKPSALFLIAMNLVPLFGVVQFGWSVGSLLLIYWLETVVIGVFNLAKIITAGMDEPSFAQGCGVAFMAVFFVFHFGMFSFGHFIFIRELFGAPAIDTAALIAVTGLALSHAFSFAVNWLGKREFSAVTPGEQMVKPYNRVMVMHIVILIGGGISQWLGSPLYALILLVGLKTAIDLRAHAASHGWTAKPQAT